MNAETLVALFSHLCGQGRVFVVDGCALPVCERCFGLYAGAALTGLWLLASGTWRRGLPDRPVVLANIAMLLAAMAGGLHLVDAGPAWRLVCGLWTGHVALLWLIGAAGHFHRAARSGPPHPPWPLPLRLQALAAAPALALLAVLFTRLVTRGWVLWTALIVLGAAALLAALLSAVLAMGVWLVAALRKGTSQEMPRAENGGR